MIEDHLVDQLFRSAFQNLSNVLFGEEWPESGVVCEGWRRFCNRALITIVQGENPNPSDSGWLFARKARQTLGIDQDQLREPREVVAMLADGFSGPVVFVDDFVGSGVASFVDGDGSSGRVLSRPPPNYNPSEGRMDWIQHP